MSDLDENEIVEAMCAFPAQSGFELSQRLHTTQQGVDNEATHAASGRRLYMEAKGATSSRMGSPRFGKVSTPTQVYDRVAEAIYAELCLRAAHPKALSEQVVLAVPDSPLFRKRLEIVREQ